MIKITLDETEFKALVAGAVVSPKRSSGEIVEIALLDIGFDRMHDAILDAQLGVKK